MPVTVHAFPGHIGFGTTLVCIAIWWTIGIFRRYFKQLSKNKPFYSTTWYPTKFTKLPVEPFVKFGIGIFTGSVMWFDFIRSISLDDGQASTAGPHAVATGVYIFIPIVEILQFYQLTVVGTFENITFTMHILGILAGVIAFGGHGHGRMSVDAHIHQLLNVSFILALISVILDYKFRNSVMVSLSKVYFYLITGFWLISAAFMLDSRVSWIPAWDLQKSDNVTLATCLYVFFMMVTIVYMCLTACFIGKGHKYLTFETQAKCSATSSNGISNGIVCKTV